MTYLNTQLSQTAKKSTFLCHKWGWQASHLSILSSNRSCNDSLIRSQWNLSSCVGYFRKGLCNREKLVGWLFIKQNRAYLTYILLCTYIYLYLYIYILLYMLTLISSVMNFISFLITMRWSALGAIRAYCQFQSICWQNSQTSQTYTHILST